MAGATRRGLAIGCGGTLGFAWTAVALREVERALDWDARAADVLIGTSAGSELVASLGSGRTPQAILDALDETTDADPVLTAHLRHHPGSIPPRPGLGLPGLGLIGAGLRGRSPYTALAGLLPRGRGDATWLRAFGDALSENTEWVSHPNTWIVAADGSTGQRVAFGRTGSPSVDLGSAIAASWAIPGWFPPVEIAGRHYVDGGAVSSVSADLALDADLDELIVVAPMTSEGGAPATGLDRVERLLRTSMTSGLDCEVAILQAAGVRVTRIEPGPAELAAMGPNFMDVSRRAETLRVTRDVLPERVVRAVETLADAT